MASEAACNKHGLTPLARVTGYGIAGIFELKTNICCLICGQYNNVPGISLSIDGMLAREVLVNLSYVQELSLMYSCHVTCSVS